MVIKHYKVRETTILLPWSSSTKKLEALQYYCHGHQALQSKRRYNIIAMVIKHYKVRDTTILLPWSSSITKLQTLQYYCHGHQALQSYRHYSIMPWSSSITELQTLQYYCLGHQALQSYRHYNIISMVIKHYKVRETTILLPWSSSITKLEKLQYCKENMLTLSPLFITILTSHSNRLLLLRVAYFHMRGFTCDRAKVLRSPT